MRTYKKLRSLLGSIPNTLFSESNESDFLDWMLDGLRLLPDAITYAPKIEIFEIIDGKVVLPKDVKQINSVMWQCSDPDQGCIDDLLSCSVQDESSDINPAICRPSITYKMFLDSPYFNKHFKVLKYVGIDKSLIKPGCPCRTATCSETFVVTPQKVMHLSLNEGFICVDYDVPVCDENDELLIPDDEIVSQFLVTFAISKHWENRQFSKEEQAANFYDKYNQKQALLLRQARGKLMLNAVDFANLMDLNGQFTKLIKLPEILFYAR